MTLIPDEHNHSLTISKISLNLISILLLTISITTLIIIPVEKNAHKTLRLWSLVIGAISSGICLTLTKPLETIEKELQGQDYLKTEDRITRVGVSQYLNEQKYTQPFLSQEPETHQPSYLDSIMKMFDEVEVKPEPNHNQQNLTNSQSNELIPNSNHLTITNHNHLTLFDWNNFKNKDEFPNLAVIGKPGSGKSTLAQWLGSIFSGFTIAIAPHYKSGDFPTADLICGKGRNYGAEVEQEPLIPFNQLLTGKHNLSCLGVIKSIHHEMTNRYQLDDYENPNVSFPITLILDEYNSWAKKKGLSDYMGELLREARKVNIRIIILCHQFNVKPLGFEGEGDIRKSINQIRLNSHALEEAKVRLNNAKFNSANYQYWETINHELANSNRCCLVDDYLAQIPDLTNWLATPNPKQLVLGNHQQSHPHLPTPTSTYNATGISHVGNYQHHQQLAQYLDNLYEMDYQPPTSDENVCPYCSSINVIKWGKDRKKCKDCNRTFSI